MHSRIEGGGISMPNAGGAVFGGPMPTADSSAVTDARLAEIAKLQGENAEAKASLKQVQDYAVLLSTRLSEQTIELAQSRAEIERLKIELVNAKAK